MRVFRFTSVILFLLITLAAAPVFASPITTVDMTFVGPGGNNSGGVYTYPYNFSINGSSTMTPLICDAFDNEVSPGESWTATVTPLIDGTGLWGTNVLDYKAAGLIFEGILNGTINPNAGNWAIWGLFSSNAQSNSYFSSSGAGSLDTTYLADAGTAPNSMFNGLVLYTPQPGTQTWGGTPQEYIGYVCAPEPSELSLMGLTFLFLLGALVYKNRTHHTKYGCGLSHTA
ncbi:MAG TPA: hypothetical protein VLW84_03645 [Terriglobales bacterium]|nr:hypothetical protein [Terriglobales bacterium]